MTSKVAVVLLSGGLDSAVLAAEYIKEGYDVHALFFSYGQKNKQAEHKHVTKLFDFYPGMKHFTHIDLSHFSTNVFHGKSALLAEAGFTPVELAEEDISARFVPVRNAIFLSTAWAYGLSLERCDVIGIGTHVGLNATYPDATPEFVTQMNLALREGSRGQRNTDGMRIEAPYQYEEKAGIIEIGKKLSVPFQLTWSCFSTNYDQHCGICATCQARKRAFAKAEVPDPTRYDQEEGAYRG